MKVFKSSQTELPGHDVRPFSSPLEACQEDDKWCEPSTIRYASHAEVGQVQVLRSRHGGVLFAPLQATGDGNCLLHAVSKVMFGVECWYKILRQMMVQELKNYPIYYQEYLGLGKQEFEAAIADGENYDRLGTGRVQDGHLTEDAAEYLSMVHVAALAGSINRPITLFAPPEHMKHGVGFGNQCGTVMPRAYVQRGRSWQEWVQDWAKQKGLDNVHDLMEPGTSPYSSKEYELKYEKGLPACQTGIGGSYILQVDPRNFPPSSCTRNECFLLI